MCVRVCRKSLPQYKNIFILQIFVFLHNDVTDRKNIKSTSILYENICYKQNEKKKMEIFYLNKLI